MQQSVYVSLSSCTAYDKLSYHMIAQLSWIHLSLLKLSLLVVTIVWVQLGVLGVSGLGSRG